MARAKYFIVDDDPIFVKLLERELNEAKLIPYETHESGEACLEHIKMKPKLVLLDFSLAGLNGLDVLTKIKLLSPNTDVIMLTAVDDAMVEEKCLAAGAKSYIHKNPDGLERFRADVVPIYQRKGLFSFFR